MELLIRLAAALLEIAVDEIWPRQAEAPAAWMAHVLRACAPWFI